MAKKQTEKHPEQTGPSTVSIEQPKILALGFEIKGQTLIQNAFNQKAVEQMLRKHMNLPFTRDAKIPRQVIEDATIRNMNGIVCVPPTAIKKAMLSAAGSVKGLKKTQLRTQLFVEGGSLPLTFARMVPRMDMVRTSGMSRTPDVRFRPMFEDWSVRLVLQFADSMPAQTVADLLNRAGKVGIGEWRPEKDGTHGTFYVSRLIDTTRELAEVRDLCSVPIKPLVIPEWAMGVELPPELLAKIVRGPGGSDAEESEAEDSDD